MTEALKEAWIKSVAGKGALSEAEREAWKEVGAATEGGTGVGTASAKGAWAAAEDSRPLTDEVVNGMGKLREVSALKATGKEGKRKL